MLDKPKDQGFESAAGRSRPAPRGTMAEAGHARQIEPDEGLSVAVLLNIIRRRRWPLIICLVLFPVAALLAVQQMTPRYTASATVIFEPQEFAARELQSILNADTTTDTIVNSQVQIINSFAMADRVAERLNLAARPEFNFQLREQSPVAAWMETAQGWLAVQAARLHPDLGALLEVPPRREPTAERVRLNVANAALGRLDVQVVARSRVMNVSFTSENPQLAAQAANLAAEFYINDQLEAKFEAVRRANAWLESRIAGLRQEVLDAEEKIQRYRAERGLVQGVSSTLISERISRLQLDLLEARGALSLAESRQVQARNRNFAGLAQVQNNAAILNLRNQESQLRSQEATLASQLGDRHPDVVRVRNALRDNGRLLGAEMARVVAGIESEVEAARLRVETLTSALEEARLQVNQAGADEITVRVLEREAEASRTLLTQVLSRSQQTVAQSAIEKPDARVLSPAVQPAMPSWPKRTLILAGSIMLGLMFGLMVIYFLELADRSIQSGDELRLTLGLPCIALVPELRRRLGRGGRPEDFPVKKPLSSFAEAMRSARASLWLGDAPPKCVVVTAARPGEGKTTVAISMARVAALGGERVVVVDCDLRQPSFGRVFGHDDGQGVVDYLMGHASLSAIRKRDRLTQLDYIPAGTVETNASALFMGEAMAKLIDQLKRDYDLVVLDAPPALAVSDARVVARLADATLLCVRWRDTPRSVARSSLDMLEQAQARVVGALLTRVDAKTHSRSGAPDAEVYHPRYGGYFRE